ncbi:hypothetical protein PUN28_019676 [Cardiocondyla obscurior]|uniref:DUF4806 domain-containing protein n=1 Tax=Cardiocondyla obscurior TaxID=286306 RepID=A0AAW2EDY4_9HYME
MTKDHAQYENLYSHGNNAHIMMRNIFKTAITDKLATNFSWTGKKNKKPFKDLEISKLMIQAVRILYDDITESDFADYASKWLAQASVRVQRRN